MIDFVLFYIVGNTDVSMFFNNEDGHHSCVKRQRFIMIFLYHITGYFVSESGWNLELKTDNVIASWKIYSKLKML
jgi:hypothetical protein